MALTTTPTSGFGSTISGATTSPVANVRSITIAGITRNMLDITVHGTASGWMAFAVSGLQDAGEFTLELLYEETTYTKFVTAISGPIEVWTLTMAVAAGGAKMVASGAVTNLTLAVPHDDVITYDVTIKLTGQPVYTGDPA